MINQRNKSQTQHILHTQTCTARNNVLDFLSPNVLRSKGASLLMAWTFFFYASDLMLHILFLV